MRTLLVSSALFLTIGMSMGLGVGLGYAAICGILRLMGGRPRRRRPAPVLVPAALESGD